MFRETSSFFSVKSHSPQSGASLPTTLASASPSPATITSSSSARQSKQGTPSGQNLVAGTVRKDLHDDLLRAIAKRKNSHKRCASEGGVHIPRSLSISGHADALSTMPSLSTSCSQNQLDLLTKDHRASAAASSSSSVSSFSLKHRLGPFYDNQSLENGPPDFLSTGQFKPSSWLSLTDKLGSLSLSATWSGHSASRNGKLDNGLHKVVDVLKVPAKDLASQLTLLDFPHFRAIRDTELLSLAWNTADKRKVTPNIVSFTRRFNQVTFWVVEEVLLSSSKKQVSSTSRLSRPAAESEAKVRAQVLCHFIKVAKRLEEDHNNLHSCYAIVSALNSLPIYRLAKTWACVPKKDKATFDRLSKLFSDERNFEELRGRCSKTSLPCICYLGMYLRDLIYVDIVNPVSPSLTSDTRNRKLNAIIEIIQNFQKSSYDHIERINHIHEYLSADRYIEELQKFLEDQNYRLSLELEPPPGPPKTVSTPTEKSPKATKSREKSTFYVDCWQTKL